MKIVNYEERFGVVHFPEGFEAQLKGRAIQDQMEFYRTSCNTEYEVTGWKKRNHLVSALKLEEDPTVTAIIVRDGIVVGVMVLDDCNREVPCLPEKGVCTYYASDNNGAGSKDRIDYTYLVCVPENFA